MTSKKVHFRVSGKITKLLGRESVSEAITALFEVLKNAHDADALSVSVAFRDIQSGLGKIIIRETGGDGMTYEDTVTKFFVIGTHAKEPTSDEEVRETRRYHRKMLGNKGVGRFALEKLGREAKIISKPINTDDKFTFVIDWDKFEPKEVTVDQVGIDIVHEKRDDVKDSGLEIEISRLRDYWDYDAVKKLEFKIQRLILPEEFQSTNAFNIVLDAPEFGYEKKPITVALLKRSYYYLKAELFEDRIKVYAKIKDTPVISSRYKNDVITEFAPYEPGVRITQSEKTKGIKYVKDLTCGPVQLIVYYFPVFQRNTPENRDAMRYYGEVFGHLIDSDLPKYAGVRIFRDGLREFTYGDPRNDWVERASISRNLSGTVQADRLVGFVFISNEHNRQIIATTNRQTADENQAFLDLREFVIQSMLHFDHYLNRERRKEIEKRYDLKSDREAVNQLQNIKKKFTNPNSNISKALTRVRDLTGEDYTPEVGNFLDAIDNAKGRLEIKIETAEAEMTENQIERSLASLGNIVSMMIHEINDAITITFREVNKLRKHSTGSQKLTDEELNQIYFNIYEPVNKIKNWNDFVDRFTTSLTLEDIHSRREEILNPHDITRKFIVDVKKILLIPFIDIRNEIDPKLEIKMFGAYFDSIIGNLMSNAIKAINSQDDKETRENKITVRTEKTNQHLVMYFSDNGPGIPKERWETVFEPHISTTSKNTLFKGHGLGLPIVHSMVREYDGDIKNIDPVHGQGTTFCITIPWKAIDPKS